MTRLAAPVADRRVGPMVAGIVPDVGGPNLPSGGPATPIGGRPAARVSDLAVGPPGVITFTCAMRPERAAR